MATAPDAGGAPLAQRIDALLPQTQCTRCGFAGCRPYAEALALGQSDINRCPPGGMPVMRALAALLERPERAIDPDCGEPGPPLVAVIDEPECIGCAKCIDACPTDAIVGARKWLHAVLPEDCSGCELCVPACPVDCIRLDPAPGLPGAPLGAADLAARAAHFRSLHEARLDRRARDAARRQAGLAARLAAQAGETS
ncbi:MAG: RnfABCDGE type electron transport complex subunit B [Steroidobacteraceae bacterium]|jgi:electron transport complex protein RnfB|nr:RnfABCDGE type electron transport complex subunit B [Steroidobacteraceae bacterium]